MESPRVLVVEAASSARDALAALLGDADLEITVVDAIDDPSGYAVALVDVEPGNTATVDQLAALEHPPEIIAMVEYGAATDALLALRAGASDYVIKPIRADELFVVIGKAVQRHELGCEVKELRTRLSRLPLAV